MKQNIFEKSAIGFSVALLALTACMKTEIELNNPHTDGVNIPQSNGGKPNGTTVDSNGHQTTPSTTTLMGFTAMIEGLNLTRSTTPIAKNVAVNIFAYDSATVSLNASGNYVSTSLGNLTGANGYQMYLPNGVYDFYATSCNNNTSISFNGTTSAPLTNGIDYLWWEAQNQWVYSSAMNLHIVFTHCACQVVFHLSAGSGVTLDSLVAIYTTAPTEGATMNLLTGNISPATSQQTGFVNEMGVNGLTAQSILLPCDNWPYMGINIHALINGENTLRFFGGQIPLPNGSLKAGNSYQFSLELNAQQVTASSVSVSGWTIVKNNKPIYPAEL